MLYMIHAGDTYAAHQEFLFEGPEGLDLAVLEVEYEKTLPQLEQIPGFIVSKENVALVNENRTSSARRREQLLAENGGEWHAFLYTQCFVRWLCNHHGCNEVAYKFHCTEN